MLFKKILIVIAIWSVPALAGNEKSNQAIGDSLCEALFDSIATFVPKDSMPLGIGIESLEPAEQIYVRKCFVRNLKSKGYNLLLSDGPRKLTITSFKVTVRYEADGWRWFGLKQTFKRRVFIRIEGWLETGSRRRVLTSFELNKSYTDHIQNGSSAELEESTYPFFKGIWQKPSLWMRALQPVLVGSVLTAVVYLFFTVRS